VVAEGTHTGVVDGSPPPSGRRFSARQSHWFRVRDGRLVEHWAVRDDLTTMLQLGIVQEPGATPSR
jgi:predicted ester cyclase